MREVVKREQFINCLPVEIHRLVVERHPKLVPDAAILADEYAVLYKTLKLEQSQHQTVDNVPNNLIERGKSFHNSRARGRDNQIAHFRGGFSHNIRCGNCGRDGQLAPNCRIYRSLAVAPVQSVTVVALVTTNQISPLASRMSKVHNSYAPYCYSATLFTNKVVRRDNVYFRDSGSLQTLSSKETLSDQDYIDTAERRLIEGILRIPTKIPFDFQNDKVQDKILCGLVDSLAYGVDILVGNYLGGIMPFTVSVVTRAGTETTNTQNVVRP